MPTRAFEFELKELTDKGEFTGLASVYNVVDGGFDLVEPGSFTKSIQQSGKERPLLWRHDAPIGLVSLRDTPAALVVDGKLSLGLQAAKDALVLLRDGVVKGLSIGFQTMRDEMVGNVRHLKEIKLWEVSLVPFPMNQDALVQQVKNAQQDDAIQLLKDMRRDILGALANRKVT
jgi:HK97 family phage prohead protease